MKNSTLRTLPYTLYQKIQLLIFSHVMPESFIVSRYKQCMLYAWYKNLSFINLTTYFQAKYRQLLCENRIHEFDKEIETGVLPSKLSILDAIQMTATAWDRVTTNTIKKLLD